MPRRAGTCNPLPSCAIKPAFRCWAFIIWRKEPWGGSRRSELIGSIAFAAVARVVMIATKTPPRDGERNERRVLIRAKSNIGPDEGGYVYSLEQSQLNEYPGIFASRALWGEAVEGTAREVLAEAESESEHSPREDAKEFLRSFLSEGPATAKEVQGAARKEGISLATLKRAKVELHIRTPRIGFGKDSVVQWQLSENNTIPALPILILVHFLGVSQYGEREPAWSSKAGNSKSSTKSEEVEF